MTKARALVAALVALLGVAVQTQAATWVIVNNSDCTGFAAATGLTTANVNCCTGSRQGACEHRGTGLGTEFTRIIYAVTGATQTYTALGDVIPAAQMAKIGFTNLLYATCNASTAGHVVVLERQSNGTVKVRLYGGPALGESATTANLVSNLAANCVVYGH